MEAGVSTGTRTTRFMMEGVGARVIRGPEWKWGKQVSYLGYNYFFCFLCKKYHCTRLTTLSILLLIVEFQKWHEYTQSLRSKDSTAESCHPHIIMQNLRFATFFRTAGKDTWVQCETSSHPKKWSLSGTMAQPQITDAPVHSTYAYWTRLQQVLSMTVRCATLADSSRSLGSGGSAPNATITTCAPSVITEISTICDTGFTESQLWEVNECFWSPGGKVKR